MVQQTRRFVILIIFIQNSGALAAALPIEPSSWTLVVLPDTQNYKSETGTIHHFHAQTQWIIDHVQSHNIKYVLHEGDIVDRNSIVAQWDDAYAAISRLNGAVPYALVVGNHDINLTGTQPRSSRFNLSNYFGPGSFYASQPGMGFFEAGKTDNSYHTFSAGGHDWLVLALEYGPRDQVVSWANEVADAHPGHSIILLTHLYLYNDDTRYDWHTKGDSQLWSVYRDNALVALPGGVNDGEELWQNLVSRHPNFRFVFSGHVLGDGEGYLQSNGVYGNGVHQLLANYQHIGSGGQGYLRIHEFKTDGTVQISTYSPSLDVYHPGAAHHFTLSLEGPRLAGDFNNDRTIDAADYVMWRKVAGSEAQYRQWRAALGYAPAPLASVPEPTVSVLLLLSTLWIFCRGRGRKGFHVAV